MTGLGEVFGSIQFGSFIQYGSVFLWILLGCACLIPVLYFLMLWLFYKHNVLGFEVVGDSVQVFRDKAALTKDKETKKVFQFKLWKKKAILPPPPSDAYVFDQHGKKAILIAQISPTDFVYVKPSPTDIPMSAEDKKVLDDMSVKYSYIKVSDHLVKKEVNLVPIEQDTLFWYANMLERQNEKYAKQVKWWQNPYILGLGCMAICLVILIITFKYAGTWQVTAKETALGLMEAGKGYVGQVVN